MLKGEDMAGVGALEWLNHGSYLLKGIEGPLEVCEVGEVGMAPLQAPAGSEKAQRQVTAEAEAVLGWRPAVGQVVPSTRWRLETKLGEGGFGEVWLGRHQNTKERRVFKFCFQAERVRFLKREMTLFRVLKERVGDHPNIVRLIDVMLDHSPFYVEMDYLEGADLRSWCEQHGGAAVPLATQLEIVAQAADGLQAAHEAGIIHRDIKPANILVGGKGIEPGEIRVKLTDFGIGQVVSEEFLKGITRAGFTQTILSDSSSSHTGTQIYMAPELMAGKPASTPVGHLFAGDGALPTSGGGFRAPGGNGLVPTNFGFAAQGRSGTLLCGRSERSVWKRGGTGKEPVSLAGTAGGLGAPASGEIGPGKGGVSARHDADSRIGRRDCGLGERSGDLRSRSIPQSQSHGATRECAKAAG
jgi:tRNA A-37 threonylcarbamoyl transferase component Bud32